MIRQKLESGAELADYYKVTRHLSFTPVLRNSVRHFCVVRIRLTFIYIFQSCRKKGNLSLSVKELKFHVWEKESL